LEFLGIRNAGSLRQVLSGDPLSICLGFRTGKECLRGVGVDLAVYDSRGMCAIHTKSKFVGFAADLGPEKEHTITYRIEAPRLLPGQYTMTVYAYSHDGVVLHVNNIRAFEITWNETLLQALVIDEVKVAILPKYEIEYGESD
jgi:hypothetical protein